MPTDYGAIREQADPIWWLARIYDELTQQREELTTMHQIVTDLLQKAADQKTTDDSILAFIAALKDQMASAIDADDMDALRAIADGLDAERARLQAAITTPGGGTGSGTPIPDPGTSGGDTSTGGQGSDTVDAGTGTDTTSGGQAADSTGGGQGSDSVPAGSGSDAPVGGDAGAPVGGDSDAPPAVIDGGDVSGGEPSTAPSGDSGDGSVQPGSTGPIE